MNTPLRGGENGAAGFHPQPHATPRRTSISRRALLTVFGAHGLLTAAWAPQIPVVQASLGLSASDLGFALVAPGIGAIVAMPVASMLSARFAPRTVGLACVVIFTSAAVLIGFTTNLGQLFAVLLLWGAGSGALDVLMNAQAAAVEALGDRHLLSGFHAAFNIGAICGSTAAVLLIATTIPTVGVFAIIGLVMTTACALTVTRFRPVEAPTRDDPAPANRFTVIALSTLAFIVFLCEGSAGNWSASYLIGVGATAEFAGIGYVAFAVGMTLGRGLGSRMFQRIGVRSAVRIQSSLAAIVLLLALGFGGVPLGILAYFILGAGMSTIFPAIVSRLGTARGLSIVVMSGYTGMLVGPGIIGTVAAATSLPAALVIVAGLSATPAIMAPILVSRQGTRTPLQHTYPLTTQENAHE